MILSGDLKEKWVVALQQWYSICKEQYERKCNMVIGQEYKEAEGTSITDGTRMLW